MKHKHADVIHAWADGKTIQWISNRSDGAEWKDWIHEGVTPQFAIDNWRIKPEVLRYRVALMKYATPPYFGYWIMAFEKDVSDKDRDFVRWLTEWVEV